MKILDCTLRDGGYHCNWTFDKDLVNNLIESLNSYVSVIELGYKSRNKERGLWGRCDDNEVNKELENSYDNLCFMIDLKEFKNNANDLSIVRPSHSSPFSYCRVAIKYEELSSLKPVYEYLKSMGYKIFVNLMQSSTLEEGKIKDFLNHISDFHLEGVYFADSYGNLEFKTMSSILKATKQTKHLLGFHGHDNFGLSFSNSIYLNNLGYEYIDGTILGMGRGCGNTKTEQLLLYKNKNLTKKQINILEPFGKLKVKYNWGFSVNHMMSSLSGMHPTEAQEICRSNLSEDKKFESIKKLKKKKEKVSVIIPARYESSRFPGKPLAKLFGKEMILWVCEKASQAVGVENVYVASDSDKIFEVVKKSGYKYIETPSDLVTGTDRVAYASKFVDSDIIINIQGDEPLIEPEDILRVVQSKKENPEKIINCYSKISKSESINDLKIPKIALSDDQNLLYISRGAIPFSKSGGSAVYKQVCIYGFNKKDLKIFNNKKTKTEKLEDIEIIRCLDNNIIVKMVETFTKVIAVDYPEDIDFIENMLK